MTTVQTGRIFNPKAQRLTILGSTGSIGCNALQVAEHLGITVYAISAHRRIDLLAEQVRRYHPRVVVTSDLDSYTQLRAAVADCDVKVLAGRQALDDIASASDVTTVITAIVGAAGLPSTLAAIVAGKRVCIANKEPLVMAGCLVMQKARESGALVMPIDSEHSAIFQCLENHQGREVQQLVITGSGGPLRTVADLSQVTLEQALKHPTWSMGPKITVDSATLMNKSLEVIEARWLFGLELDRIAVLIHPQSIVHSMVAYRDGSMIAQLGRPDMRVPIQYALTYPEHVAGLVDAPDLSAIGALHFEQPDRKRFPSLDFAYHAAREGGVLPAVMNAANEQAVSAFLDGKIAFCDIFSTVERALAKASNLPEPSLEDIVAADLQTRESLRALA